MNAVDDAICRKFAEAIIAGDWASANGWANTAMYRASNERLKERNTAYVIRWLGLEDE